MKVKTTLAEWTGSRWWRDQSGHDHVSWNYETIQEMLLTLTNLALIAWLIREIRR